MMRTLWLLLALLLAPLAAATAADADVDVRAVATMIGREGDTALAGYHPDRGVDVSEIFSSLYFDVFESSGFEYRLGTVDAPRLTAIESRFGTVIKLCARGAPREDIAVAWQPLRAALLEAAGVVVAAEGAAGGDPMVGLLRTLLGSGLAAAVLPAVLVTLLRRSGDGDRAWLLWPAGLLAGLLGTSLTPVVRPIPWPVGAAETVVLWAALPSAALATLGTAWLARHRRRAAWLRLLEARVAQRPVAVLAASIALVFLVVLQATAAALPAWVAAIQNGAAPRASAGLAGLALVCGTIRLVLRRLPLGAAVTGMAGLLGLSAVAVLAPLVQRMG